MAEEKEKEKMEARPPVVVVLGHVDHGKSSLLEAIKEDFVILEKEAGGITQHIGAYEVTVSSKETQLSRASQKAGEGSLADAPVSGGQKITFIDTPGHEAFSAMRQRGAKVADIAILVVDATEGVKPQTKEAIKFAREANIPMVVAFNKMDKPGANPEKVKKQLSDNNVVVESYGGKIPSCQVSAKTKQGIDELLETILLLAEMAELKADYSAIGRGTVVESSLNEKRGPVATLILQTGTINNSDFIATDSAWGTVRGLTNFEGKPLAKALPSQPVSVLGFTTPPSVGEKFKICQTREEAHQRASKREKERLTPQVIEIEEGVRVLNLVLKTDVLGSAEAIEGMLKALPQEKVILRVLKSEVGDINVSDIKIASAGKARVFGFRVKIDEKAKLFTKQQKINIKTFEVIYELLQEIRKAMLNVLAPKTERINLAKFKTTVLFKKGKDSQIIGGRVIEGEITRNTKAEIIRNEEIIGKGRIKGLQKEKKDIGKAEKGQEVGILLQGETDIEQGDILQIYREEKRKGTL